MILRDTTFRRRRETIAVPVLLSIALLLCFHVHSVVSTFQKGLSLQPPYTKYDESGNRIIDKWDVGGDAEVFNNFLRLTMDRASKKGWAWSEEPVGLNQWSATLKFRVSGQGERLFGDGFALWFTEDPEYRKGKLHGYAEQFKGFGIIFDTFVNKEARHSHKDIALVTNDGQEALDVPHGGVIPEGSVGCDADFRFYERRDDFSVNSHSLAHLKFENNKASLYIDAKGLGFWETCFEDVDIPLPDKWYEQAHLGLTATTGQLADNHDILALMVSNDPNERYQFSRPEKVDVKSGNDDVDKAITTAVEQEKAELLERIEFLHHNFEHQLTSMHGEVRATLRKLQEQEERSMKRIDKIEKDLNQRMDNKLEESVEERIQRLEKSMSSNVQKTFDKEIGPSIDERIESKQGGWIIPFVILTLLVGGLAVWGWKAYTKVTKAHLP
eukprot:gb/GECG01012995.1/.p1 GENE.gb/GECG01012995.1/~~gb/GECG01012995.1/.p1  ORF type:complete len:441 (+),score=63.45 gb/GECG01012995.1/:1-1323(+)